MWSNKEDERTLLIRFKADNTITRKIDGDQWRWWMHDGGAQSETKSPRDRDREPCQLALRASHPRPWLPRISSWDLMVSTTTLASSAFSWLAVITATSKLWLVTSLAGCGSSLLSAVWNSSSSWGPATMAATAALSCL